tara:strand:- start:2515 stop:2670 length:156 start_codon:yes stop_codon:yes gene_type:complete
MLFTTTQEQEEVFGVIEIFSPIGILILIIGIIFTVGLPLIMIFKEKKDCSF